MDRLTSDIRLWRFDPPIPFCQRAADYWLILDPLLISGGDLKAVLSNMGQDGPLGCHCIACVEIEHLDRLFPLGYWSDKPAER